MITQIVIARLEWRPASSCSAGDYQSGGNDWDGDEMKPKFTRMIDGIPCMTVTEHEHIVGQLVNIIEGMVRGAEPDCGDPGCKDCEVWRPAWRAIAELKEKA